MTQQLIVRRTFVLSNLNITLHNQYTHTAGHIDHVDCGLWKIFRVLQIEVWWWLLTVNNKADNAIYIYLLRSLDVQYRGAAM